MHIKKLTIVSDTAIYQFDDKYFAFGPVIREIEFIDDLFDEITWIGFNRLDRLHDLSMQEIKSPKIKVVLLKKVGGKNLKSFVSILFQYPIMFFTILKNVYNADVVHTRAPSHPALIALLISFLFQKKIWWNKFAGNWNQKKPSYSYGFQKLVMTKAFFSKVTINGFWDDQPQHCLSFENPCLTVDDIREGIEFAKNKKFKEPFVFCFVGRLDAPKGVDRIIEALKNIESDKIAEVHFIGDGPLKETYKELTAFLGSKVIFHGFQNKDKVMGILSSTHFLLLPSNSEGFPKVIAEGACYGVIPIVSDVGSIPHYVNDLNGFLWKIEKNIPFERILKEAIELDEKLLKDKSNEVLQLADKFTFINYKKKLMQILEVK